MFPLMKLTDVGSTDEIVRPYIDDPNWVMQQKFDGTRTILFYNGANKTFFWSNNGIGPHKFSAAKLKFPALEVDLKLIFRAMEIEDKEVVLDGELVLETGVYHVFDIFYSFDPKVISIIPLYLRLENLEEFAAAAELTESMLVDVTKTARTTFEKATFWAGIQAWGVEGAVSKYLMSHYLPGMRSQQWVKHKLVKSADVVVTKVQRTFKPDSQIVKEGKAELAVYSVGGLLTKIGSASLIGKDLTIEPGDVVEIEYLYFTGSSPIQPRITKKRIDKLPAECDVDQFPEYSRKEVQF
jgi:ATP-dependent DNA ligase